MIMMNPTEQKIDLHIGDLSISIDPSIVKTFASLSGSITKKDDQQVIENIFNSIFEQFFL
jgi:general stress protein 26